MSRYARQKLLSEIRGTGQERLRMAHILVVGAGGLGCPLLSYLVGAGVGRITLVDPDIVEESNLHRQPLFTMQDIGRPKVEAAKERLIALNPDVAIHAMPDALDPANGIHLVKSCDLVVDAADSFAVSYTLSDICLAYHVPLLSASVLGHSGYVGGFCGTAPSLRAVFPDLPAAAQNCAIAGVSGAVVGVIGALQAELVIQVLTSRQNAMGRLISVDMTNSQFGGFGFKSASEPETIIPFISRSQCLPDDLVVDLREDPVERVLETQEIPLDRRIVLCCTSGLRAWNAAQKLRKRGYGNLVLLAIGQSA